MSGDKIDKLYKRLVESVNSIILKRSGIKDTYKIRDKWAAWYKRQMGI